MSEALRGVAWAGAGEGEGEGKGSRGLVGRGDGRVMSGEW
jgi:hypothetical protein